MNAKTKLDRFYKAAVELESKMDAVLFGRNDEEVDAQGHPIRNAAIAGGVGSVGVSTLANYGRGRNIQNSAFNQVARMTGAQPPLRTGLRGAFDAVKAGVNDRTDATTAAMMQHDKFGPAMKAGVKQSFSGYGKDLKAGAGALKGDAMTALANLKARLGKVVPKAV